MIKKSVLAVVCVFAFSASLEASARNRENRRQSNERNRIQQGVKSGELTKGEAKKLRAQQRRIKRAEHRSKADGVVTDAEKSRLEKRQDAASKNIYNKKHNDKERSSAEGGDQPASE